MSEKYKVRHQDRPYFITFSAEGWVDVFTRQVYKDIVLDSLRYCQQGKGLVIYAWCLMTNCHSLLNGRNDPRTPNVDLKNKDLGDTCAR